MTAKQRLIVDSYNALKDRRFPQKAIANILGVSRRYMMDIVFEYERSRPRIDTCVYRPVPRGSYFETETDIMQALEPTFDVSDLTGWELEQFKRKVK